MSTESNQSSGNRHHGSSPDEERQRTGLFRWNDSENLVPSWSVPPGLMVPGPRPPQADDAPEQATDAQAAAQARAARRASRGRASRKRASPDATTAESAPTDDSSWPGAAPPAGWFLRASQSQSQPPSLASRATTPEPAQPQNASPENASPENASPENASPENASPRARRRTRRRRRGALAPPRAGRILVLTACCAASHAASCAGRRPKRWRGPGGRPRIPA